MIGLIIIIIVNIAAAISIIITSADKIFANQEQKSKAIFQKRKTYKLTQNGRVLIGTMIVTTLIAIVQFFLTQSKENRLNRLQELKDSTIANANRIRDSISNEKIEDSKQKTIEALAKYGYKVDSLNENLIRIVKDSTNNKTTVIQGESPIVNFCYNPIGIKFEFARNDSLVFRISLCTQNSGAILNFANVHIIFSDNFDYEQNKKLHYIKKSPLLGKNLGMENGANGLGQLFTYKTDLVNFKAKTIYLVLIGEYTNTYGKELKKIKQIGTLNLLTKEGGILAGEYEDEIFKFIEDNKISL